MNKWRHGACLWVVVSIVTGSNIAFANGRPSLATKARLIGGYISNDDYPPVAKRNEENGTSVALFTIGKNGNVSDCIAFGASPLLDQSTCNLIRKRFIFVPALNKKGEAISTTKIQRVTWRLQEYESDDVIASTTPYASLDVIVDAKGKVSSCKIRRSSGDRLWDIRQCAKLKVDGLFPTYNAEGKPVKAEHSFDAPRPNPGIFDLLTSLPLPQE